MAAAPHAGAAPDGCLRDHSASHAPGTSTRPLISQPQPNPSSLSMIFRRLPASSSFVLAAARLRALQLDPGRAAGRPGQLRGRIQKNSQPSPTARVVTGSGPYALLTLVALMGADGKGEEGIDRSFERAGTPMYLGE